MGPLPTGTGLCTSTSLLHSHCTPNPPARGKQETHLIDGHCAHRHRAVAHHPLPCLVNVCPCAEVHDGVCTPNGGPLQLLNLLYFWRGGRGVRQVAKGGGHGVSAQIHDSVCRKRRKGCRQLLNGAERGGQRRKGHKGLVRSRLCSRRKGCPQLLNAERVLGVSHR